MTSIFNLARRIDDLQSCKTKIRNWQIRLKKDPNYEELWGLKLMKRVLHRSYYNMEKRSKRLRLKIQNRVKDLHIKLVNHLLRTSRVVLLPDYRIQGMITKEPSKKKAKLEDPETPKPEKKRRLNSKVARSMTTWSFFKFKERLLFKSKEYPNCKVIICQEDYTSVTCGKCGFVNKKFTEKLFKCSKCKHETDRDFNAARNVLLKYLTEKNAGSV